MKKFAQQTCWVVICFVLIELAASMETSGLATYAWQRFVRSGLIVSALNLFAWKAAN